MNLLEILFHKDHVSLTFFVIILTIFITGLIVLITKSKAHGQFFKDMFNPRSNVSSSRIYAAIDLAVIVMLSVVFSIVVLLGIKIDVNAVTIAQVIFGALVTIFGICVGGSTLSKFSAGEKSTDAEFGKKEEEIK